MAYESIRAVSKAGIGRHEPSLPLTLSFAYVPVSAGRYQTRSLPLLVLARGDNESLVRVVLICFARSEIVVATEAFHTQEIAFLKCCSVPSP